MTTLQPSDIPLSINYTNRDYYSLREELIARVQDRIPEWTASDPADFGLALVEAFAYMGDVMSYYIDRNANENFITTATQRESVLNIAQSYGYIPAGFRQAVTEVRFVNSSGSTVVIPAGTVVSGDVTIGDTVQTLYFTTDAAATCDPLVNSGADTVSASSGRSVILVSDYANEYGELVGTSDGTPNQNFLLLESPVVDGSVELYIEEGSTYSKWLEVQHLIDYGPYDQVFTTYLDSNNQVTVQFGDGISGQIPSNSSEIRAKYTVGGGSIDNVTTDILTNIYYVPGLDSNDLLALQSIVTVTNTAVGIGGSDPEETAQIRYLAPITLRTNNRAVALDDFKNLALQVSGVGKAQAEADVWTSVNLYIAPTRTAKDTDEAPGLDSLGNPTAEFYSLSDSVTGFLENKTLIGCTVTIQPPTYIDVIVEVSYAKFPQYTAAEVETAIKKAILTDFGYVENSFKQAIYIQDIEFSLQQVAGVKTAKLTVLHRDGDTGLNNLQGNADEIFRFKETNITVSAI